MDQIDVQVLSSHLRQRRDAVWDSLDICPRTCPTHVCAHSRTGMLGLQVPMLGHFWTCPFPALHALLAALQNGLLRAAQRYWLLAPCAKTEGISVQCASRMS